MQNDIRRRERERLESMSREELVAIALDLVAKSPAELIVAALHEAMHSATAVCDESA